MSSGASWVVMSRTPVVNVTVGHFALDFIGGCALLVSVGAEITFISFSVFVATRATMVAHAMTASVIFVVSVSVRVLVVDARVGEAASRIVVVAVRPKRPLNNRKMYVG